MPTTSSIASQLGAGSGIDIAQLVTSLVDAQYSAKTQQITQRQETLTAQISAVSELRSGITGFASALTSLVKGGSLATQPTSSNPNAIKVSTATGATLGALSARISVGAIAAGQVAATDRLSTTDTYGDGTGSFTLQFGTASFDGNGQMSLADPGEAISIPITKADASLSDIAAAINGAAKGVTASVIGDGNGQRLVLRGPTGAGSAFTLTSADPELAALGVTGSSGGAAVQVQARDAQITLDGVSFSRGTNTISDLVPGVRLELLDTTASPVLLTSAPATPSIVQAVSDVVDTFNQLFATIKTDTDPVTGALRTDPSVSAIKRRLQGLTLTKLIPDDGSGAPRTLAEIGVGTNRDGTLKIDATRLVAVAAQYPAQLEKIFAVGTGASENGLSAALNAIASEASSTSVGLGAAEQRYSKAQTTLSDQQSKATEQATAMRERLTRQFATMDSRVAAYRSTQTFLEQQIDAWNAQK